MRMDEEKLKKWNKRIEKLDAIPRLGFGESQAFAQLCGNTLKSD